MKPLLVAVAGGLAVGVSLPPFGLWFLAPVGYALFFWAWQRGHRLGTAAAFNTAYFLVGLAWSLEFAVVAFVGLMLIEVLLTTVPFLIPVKHDWAFPALVTLGELLRYRWPLGGLPLAGVALGQVNGPLLPLARLGGDLAIVLVLALVATRQLWAFALVVAVVGGSWFVPTPKATGSRRVAYAQGGGPRGLRAIENVGTDVFGNQELATARLHRPVDLVLWPEDVIDLAGPIAGDPVKYEVGDLAAGLQTTLVAGVVEDSGRHHFRNAAVVWDRSGKIVDRYEKVHRVPFGEYVPARSLVKHLANITPVPRDAIAGHGDGVLLTRAGQLGVMISYEVFFADRARTAVHGGAQVLLVPTNASSFKGRQVPRQEVAAARLRAVETGRDLVQAAPTGHSVFVDAHGHTWKRSRLGARAAAVTVLHTRAGTTPYQRAGDVPVVVVVLGLLVASLSPSWPGPSASRS
ncbi:MAG TPA: apolipoprotein N-acyltransferase [Acidimicrobiales bacterium]|nr:apolipoprotein N-acyltransferase [Acidimicrobiales bacterium]